MIRTTRRAAMMGALAVPTVAGLAHWRGKHGERSVLLHDPALAAGKRFAEAGQARGADVRAIEGDRIRFSRQVLESRPALIAGVSRHADFILIEDAARERAPGTSASPAGRASAAWPAQRVRAGLRRWRTTPRSPGRRSAARSASQPGGTTPGLC